jgi:hypothetical protein
VSSNYRFDLAPRTWDFIRSTRSGTAVFTMPSGPIKCAGAPQKIAYLACDHWRNEGVLNDIDVHLVVPTPRIFGIPAIAFSQVLKGWGDIDAAAATARAVIDQVLAAARPGPWLLNVNIPNRPDAASLPRVVTRLGRRHASEPVILQTSPRGDPIYWIGPAGDAREEEGLERDQSGKEVDLGPHLHHEL